MSQSVHVWSQAACACACVCVCVCSVNKSFVTSVNQSLVSVYFRNHWYSAQIWVRTNWKGACGLNFIFLFELN